MEIKEKHSPNAEEKILSAAIKEFAEFGLAGARVDRIANRAEVNKAMIYYYFRSKENLYQTIINRHFTRIGKLLEEKIDPEDSPELIFFKLAQSYDAVFEKNGELVPIFLREVASGGDRMNKILVDILTKKGLVAKLQQIIDRGKRNGLFRKVDSRQAIISFVGMNLYYLIMSPIVNSVLEIKNQKEFRQKRQKEVVDLFLHGLEVK